MSHPSRKLPRGLYKRGNCYYLDYKDETGKRIRRSAGPDLHRALDLLYKVRVPDTPKGETSLKDVLDSFVLKRRQGGVVDKTINGDLIIVHAALNHGVSIGLIKSLPFTGRAPEGV